MTTFADKRRELDRVIDLMERLGSLRRMTLHSWWTEESLKKIGAIHEDANVWRYRGFELVARFAK